MAEHLEIGYACIERGSGSHSLSLATDRAQHNG